MRRQTIVPAGQLMSDMVSALAHEKPSLPKRRAIAAVMLLLQCSFDEAASGLDAAIADCLEKGYGCQWDNDASMIVWAQQASMWVVVHRDRRERGQLLQMFPGGVG